MAPDRTARRRAWFALLVVTAVAAALRFTRLAAGLPYVFHSDAFQIDQAFSLLEFGWFVDSVNYPLALVHVYAAMAHLDHALRCAVAILFAGDPPSFASYLETLRDPVHRHALGRALSAACGTLLVPATYFLARARFDRRVALLAAAAVAVDPAHVLNAHQVRPHLPAALWIVIGTALVLRIGDGSPARKGLSAGGALGLAAACFQLGWFAFGWALAFALAATRPLRRAISSAAWIACGFAGSYLAVSSYAHRADMVRESVSATAREAASTLSLPALLAGRFSFSRLAEAAASWLHAAPVGYLLAFVFVGLAIPRGRDAVRRAVVYLGLPSLLFVVMGGFVASFARYSLAATPFVAVLAAAACVLVGRPRLAGALVAIWIASGLVPSLRFLTLIDSLDTRVSAAALALEYEERGAVVALQDRLVVERAVLSPRIFEFPPHDSAGSESASGPRSLLLERGATVFLTTPGSSPPLSASDLAPLGFRAIGTIGDAPERVLALPDLGERFVLDLMRARRTGPRIEVYARDEIARQLPPRLDRFAPKACGAEGRREIDRRLAGRTTPDAAFRFFEADLDGDEIPERCAGNVGVADLAPAPESRDDAWRSLGGSRGGAEAPRLRAFGGRDALAPWLVIAERLGNRDAIGFVLVVRVGEEAPVVRSIRMQNPGVDALVFAHAPRANVPAGLRLELQVLARGADGRIVASERLTNAP